MYCGVQSLSLSLSFRLTFEFSAGFSPHPMMSLKRATISGLPFELLIQQEAHIPAGSCFFLTRIRSLTQSLFLFSSFMFLRPISVTSIVLIVWLRSFLSHTVSPLRLSFYPSCFVFSFSSSFFTDGITLYTYSVVSFPSSFAKLPAINFRTEPRVGFRRFKLLRHDVRLCEGAEKHHS